MIAEFNRLVKKELKILRANQELRDAAKNAGVKQWEIAAHLGISEPTLVRWMRTPLSADRESAVLRAIAELSAEKQKEGKNG